MKSVPKAGDCMKSDSCLKKYLQTAYCLPDKSITCGGVSNMILSLQGCMAVGKTTAVKYLQENAPYINISYEINTDIVEEVKRRQLNKNRFDDYIEIQRLWLNKKVSRWNKTKDFQCSVMDFGAEEIEFYTLNYPKSQSNF